MRSRTVLLTLGALVVAASSALAGDLPEGAQQLSSEFPGVKVHTEGSRIVAVYGKPMTTGRTAAQAANRFLAEHSDVFNVGTLTLQPTFVTETGNGKFTAFGYNQFVQGLPVEGAVGRILVRNSADYVVSYAAGRFVRTPLEGFPTDRVTASQALASVQDLDQNGRLDVWTAPELVVFAGEADVEMEEPIRAWKFMGSTSSMADPKSFSFFVNADSGELVFSRNEIYDIDVSGTIDALATPGTLPDNAGNPPVLMPMEGVTVGIQGGNSVFANADGTFTIPNAGSGSVTVQVDMVGEWVTIFTDQGTVIQETQVVTPPGPANFTLNSPASQFDTSQVNVFLHTTRTHDFLKARAPGFPGIDISITANNNIASTCNAFYSSANQSINFYAAGGSCPNTGFSDVISHEYGHFVVNRLGLGQGGFGEGFGDCLALMRLNNFILGEEFLGPGTSVRDYSPGSPRVQYPCTGCAVHLAGETLGGCVVDLRENFKTTHGAGPGLTMAQQLFVDWSLITLGGLGSDSAHPMTVIEWLVVDDDDANQDNGTPNRTDICDAFSLYNIDCPELPGLTFVYPNGQPSFIGPGAATVVRVDVSDGAAGSPVASTGTQSVRVNGGAYTTTAMNELATNMYEILLPSSNCFDVVEYFVTVGASNGNDIDDPSGAGGSPFVTEVLTGLNSVFSDDFESNNGWTVEDVAITTGTWQRTTPSNGGARQDPANDFDGSGQCFVTDDAFNADIDGGPTRLISPAIDLSSGDAEIKYARWYSSSSSDPFTVEVSGNGSTWVLVDTITDGGSQAWVEESFVVGDFITPTATTQVRFSATDNPNDSVGEAGIDAFDVVQRECTDPTDQPDLAVEGIQVDFDPSDGDVDAGPGAIGQAANVLVSVRNTGNLPIISANIQTGASVSGGSTVLGNTVVTDWDAAPGVQALGVGSTATVIVSYGAGALDRCGTYTIDATHDAVNLESQSMMGGSAFGDVDGGNDSTSDNSTLELAFGTFATLVEAPSIIIEDASTEKVRLNIDYVGLGPGGDSHDVRLVIDLTDNAGVPVYLSVHTVSRNGVRSSGMRNVTVRFFVDSLFPPPAPGATFKVRARLRDVNSSEDCIEALTPNTTTIQ